MALQQRSDFKGLNDLYLDTAQYNLDPAFQNLFLQDPKEMDQRRINAYRYFMDFYKGKQWEEAGEWNPAFGGNRIVQEEFNRRTWPLSRAIVDKLISFLVKEPWTVKLPKELQPETEAHESPDPTEPNTDPNKDPSEQYDPGQPQNADNSDDAPYNVPTQPNKKEANPISDILEAVWRANNREQFSYDMAAMGCITGDCFVKVYYDEDFYAEGVGELKFQVLDSRTVIPFFDGQDKNKLIGARIQYPMFELQADGSKKKVSYTEVHTDSNIITFIDGEVDNVAPNPLGELLIIHIKNEPLPFERFGRSDLEDLILLQKEFNEKTSDFSEILAYHAAPVTIVKGARLPTLDKGARKVWAGIPEKGDVFNLNLEADLSSSLEYMDRLKKMMHELGNVPEEALGALQNVSNTSGAALHVQYQPLIERIQKKQICYALGLQKLNGIILRFYEAVGALELPEDVPPSLKYQTYIEWGDALPRDRSIDLSDIATEMGLGIESKRGALRRLGEEDPESKLEEIREEQLEDSQMDFMTAGLSQFGDPGAGPDSMGTAPGAQDGPQKDVSGAVNASKTNPNTHSQQTSIGAVKSAAQTSTGKNKKRPF